MHVVVVVHAVHELLAGMAAVGEVEVVVVDRPQMRPALLREQHVVEADPVARRVDVQLADRIGLVAAIAEALRDGRQARHAVDRAEDPVAVGAGGGAGHQRAPRRDADRAFAVGAAVAHAHGGEPVQGRGLDVGMAGDTEQRPGPLVDHHQHHIRAGLAHAAVPLEMRGASPGAGV
ncbi:MAG: hypothetical protein R3D28_24480 [Geminicoccaceae bacterium]